MKIIPIICKSALTGSKGNYTLNPYTGCTHHCVYCYASYVMRYRTVSEPWGTWIEVKTNLPEVLSHQLKKPKPMHVFMSTVCDVCQPLEARFRLTRECLKLLAEASGRNPDLSVFMLTKSCLVAEYQGILKDFRTGSFELGFSFSSFNDEIAAIFEPSAPPPSERLKTACEMNAGGVHPGVMLSPVLPCLTERELVEINRRIKQEGLRFAGYDTLNYLDSHVGPKVRPLYVRFGKEAVDRLNFAAKFPEAYGKELKREIEEYFGK